MPLLTQYACFFISPFGEKTVCGELNAFFPHQQTRTEQNALH
jgi:hypothetical protein